MLGWASLIFSGFVQLSIDCMCVDDDTNNECIQSDTVTAMDCTESEMLNDVVAVISSDLAGGQVMLPAFVVLQMELTTVDIFDTFKCKLQTWTVCHCLQ